MSEVRKQIIQNTLKNVVILEGREVEYILKISSKARGVRLAIYHDGSFVVTVPKKYNEKKLEEFIIHKSDWVLKKIDHFKKHPRLIIQKHTVKEINEYKLKAKELVVNRLEYWNTFYNFTYNKITIKNTKSRWGSCSKKGNLNFNYKILLLSSELADYIIVHELCHLREMNHSPKFWSLVGKIIPNYLLLRKQLKTIH